MPRFWTHVTFWAVGLLFGAGVLEALPARAAVRSETLLPDTTKGFVAIDSVDRLQKHWNQTQLGQLMADPVMEPFKEDLKRQLQERLSGLQVRLGMKLEDLKDVSSGELAVALILPMPDQSALALVVDVTGRHEQADVLLEKVSAELKRQKATRSEKKVEALAGATIIQFDVPVPKNNPLGKPHKVFYARLGNVLAASDNLQVLVGILARSLEPQEDSLADLEAYLRVMQRCADDAGNRPTPPQIRWFVHPLGYVEAIQAAVPKEDRRKGKSVIEMLEDQGFEAILGIGGFVDFATEEYEMVHRTAVYAPPPYKNAMKMLVFPNGRTDATGKWIPNDFAPQSWVPRDIATYTTFYCDIKNVFDNVGPMFDELVGGEMHLFNTGTEFLDDLSGGELSPEFRKKFKAVRINLPEQVAVTTRTPQRVWKIRDGKETFVVRKRGDKLRIYQELSGIWEETKRSLLHDKFGPQYDIDKDLAAHLGRRITLLTDYELPITPNSERLLFAVEARNEKQLAATIDKIMKAGATAKRHVIEGRVIWEMVEEKGPQIPEVKIGELPNLGPVPPPRIPRPGVNQQENQLLPHAAVTVCEGHLWIASHKDFLLKVLKAKQPRETLGGSADYRLVDARIGQFGIPEKCARVFLLTDEAYRPTYELIRQGKMPESKMLLGKLLNALLAPDQKGVARPQQIDGTKLPPFNVVRRYLGPAGLMVTTETDEQKEPTGWFIKGFTLKKQ